MKKILIALLALGAAVAAPAKTADELRVYINPGHGSWTGNDRPNPLVNHGIHSRTNTDTLGFFESNTNLRKGFGVLEKLRVYGLKYDPTLNQTGERHRIGAARDMSNNIVMSHVKCGPYNTDNGTASQLGAATPANLYYYNRNLPEICAEVEANHFDMFISIHSNAATEGTNTNYPLYLYRGYTTPTGETGVTLAHQQNSRSMADKSWGYAIENPHMMWTNYKTSKNIQGDINSYGSSSTSSLGYKGYLGVLKHSAPGFLVEGYFHTYQPARHKAMNFDACYVEGYAYAHGIADYFGLTKEKTGDIYGIVRSATETYTHTYYNPNTTTLDKYKPLNGCTVILKNGTAEVARVTTDNYYNGGFVFKNVNPGSYTLVFEAKGYETGTAAVTVKAANTVYPTVQLTLENYVAPALDLPNYPDPVGVSEDFAAKSAYDMTTVYADQEIPELKGLVIRRAILHKGKLYILGLSKAITYGANIAVADQPKPTIIVYDVNAKKVLANVSTSGAAGTFASIADIQVTGDGYLLGINGTKTHYDASQIQTGDVGRGTFKIYKWANDANGLPTGNPAEWITGQNSGLWFRAYPCNFSYSGTSNAGIALIAMPTITSPYKCRATYIRVAAGKGGTPVDYRANVGNNAFGEMGKDLNLLTSPVAADQAVLLDSTKGAQSWDYASAIDGDPTDQSGLNGPFAKPDGRADCFRMANSAFMVMPLNSGGSNTGLVLADITESFAKAKAVTLSFDKAPAALATTATAAAGEAEAEKDATGKITNAWFNLYLLRDGKLTKYSSKTTTVPAGEPKCRAYAYKLSADKTDNGYDITFFSTGDAPEANLVMTPVGMNKAAKKNAVAKNTIVTIPLGSVVQGENNFSISNSEFNGETQYNWAVEITSDPIAKAALVFSEPSGVTARGSVIPMTDPEYPESFGYVAVAHGKNQGVDIYDPQGNKVASRLHVNHTAFGGVTTNTANPFRGSELRGKAVFATWGDGAHGAVVLDLVDSKSVPTTLFAGTKQSSGNFIHNGVNLGGGCSGLGFVGTGDNTYMISFSEDHENLNGNGDTENSLVRYLLGGEWQLTTAPEVLGYKAFLANTNVDVLGYGDGVFVSQIRGTSNGVTNNVPGCPIFAYISNILTDKHAVALTSADPSIVSYMQQGTSGIAISPDGSIFAATTPTTIEFFDVAWDDNGKPAMTHTTSVPCTNTWAHMRFDAGNNLHVYNQNNGYQLYTVPSKAPVASVAAPMNQVLTAIQTSVEDIDAADIDAAAVYYNLQGVRVAADHLTSGVYVRVSGNKATKIRIR